jgi:hypothetical protein
MATSLPSSPEPSSIKRVAPREPGVPMVVDIMFLALHWTEV